MSRRPAPKIDPGAPLKNARQEMVAQGVAAGMSWAESMSRAGYKRPDGHQHRLRKDPMVAARLEHLRGQLATRAELTRADTAMMLREQVVYDPLELFDVREDGLYLRRLDQVPEHVRRMIQSIEVDQVGSQESPICRTKIKLVDRQKALDMMNRMIGAYEADNRQKATTQAVIVVPGQADSPAKWAEVVREEAAVRQRKGK